MCVHSPKSLCHVKFYIMKTTESLGFPGGSDDKASACKQETQVRSLGREDPLEKEIATHSSTLAWKIPWTEEPGGLQSMGLQRVGHDCRGLHDQPAPNRPVDSADDPVRVFKADFRLRGMDIDVHTAEGDAQIKDTAGILP